MSEDKERPSLRQSRPSSTSSSNSEWELIPEFPSPLEEHKHLIPPIPAVSNIATVTTYSMSNHMHTILTVYSIIFAISTYSLLKRCGSYNTTCNTLQEQKKVLSGYLRKETTHSLIKIWKTRWYYILD